MYGARTYKINKSQVKIIYTLGQELGIVDRMVTKDSLHEMVESITGKIHISELTGDEAIKVIDRLKGNMKGVDRIKEKPKNTVSKDRWNQYAFGLTSRPGMASLKQLEFIRAMMFELKNRVPGEASLDDRLRGWLEKYNHTSDVKFLTPGKARIAIEGLKKYLVKLGWSYKEV